MMRRHLIALFVLFSGLAAVQAPANASTLESMVFDARALARANDGGTETACVCEQKAERKPGRCHARDRARLPGWLRNVVLPSVVFGSDRALE